MYRNIISHYKCFVYCSAKRSFSLLKSIKNYLWSRMSEERSNSLAILNIEAELTNAGIIKMALTNL